MFMKNTLFEPCSVISYGSQNTFLSYLFVSEFESIVRVF